MPIVDAAAATGGDSRANRSDREMATTILWASLLFGSTLSLIVSYKVATQSILLGSREGRWVYPYVHVFSGLALTVFFCW